MNSFPSDLCGIILAVIGKITGRSERCPVYRWRSRVGHHQRTHPASKILEIRQELRHVPVLRFGFCSHRVDYPSYEVFSPPLCFVALSSRISLNRLKCGSEDMSGVMNQLNWRNDTRFVQLSGTFPVESAIPLQDGVINFSTVTRISDKVWGRENSKRKSLADREQDVTYSRRDVTRGFSSGNISNYDEWVKSGTRPYGPFER